MANPLYSVPGLGGYLASQDMRQDQDARQIQQAIGLASLLERRRAAEQEAQLAPLRMQLMQAQADQARGLAEQRSREGALEQAIPELARKHTGEKGLNWGAFANELATIPGGLDAAMKLRRADEDRAARVAQTDAILAQREAQALRANEINLMKATTQEQVAAANRQHQQVMAAIAAQRAANGGGGGGRMFPFRYSVDGKNVQGWRDSAGNFYDADRRPVSGVQPEITAADQALARKNTEETAAVETIRSQLSELEDLAKSNPRSVAGPLSGLTRGFEAVATTAIPGSVGLQATTAQQLIRSIIGNLPKAGRLAVYQQQEMRRLFEDGLSGNAESLQKGIELLRQNLGPREAATQAPIGRSRPGGSAIPPPPPGFKVD